MSTQTDFQKPTQSEIETSIQNARQMRSEYLAKIVKAGLSHLNAFLGYKRPAGNASA